MAVRIKSITVDCTDPYRLAQFWSRLTGFVEDPDNGNEPDDPEALLLAPDGSTALLFIGVPEPKQVKNRVHLDLVPRTQRRDEQIAELLGVGARLVDDRRHADGTGWVVLADPEGNEFCIERSDAERTPTSQATVRLRCAIAVAVREDDCDVTSGGVVHTVGYATTMPAPRTERVSPGHLVAVATAPDGGEVVVWRWYDAVVLGAEHGVLRLWEPAHGEVLAQPRTAHGSIRPGTRRYLSAGLPGADWWVAGDAEGAPEDADVEVREVERFYTDNDLWSRLLPATD